MGFRADVLNLYNSDAQLSLSTEEYRYHYSFITCVRRMYEKQRGIENNDP